MKKILITLGISCCLTSAAFAICAQASPLNCSYYVAVACDVNGVNSAATSAPEFANAYIYTANYDVMAFQRVTCGELESPDPYDESHCPNGGH